MRDKAKIVTGHAKNQTTQNMIAQRRGAARGALSGGGGSMVPVDDFPIMRVFIRSRRSVVQIFEPQSQLLQVTPRFAPLIIRVGFKAAHYPEAVSLTMFWFCSILSEIVLQVWAVRMSDWGLHRSWRQKRLFIWRWRKHSVRDVSFGRSLRAFVLSLGGLVGALDLGRAAEVPHSEEVGSERATYARAVEHCRGRVKRPMALDLDKRVLCFDGWVAHEQDVSIARELKENGLFVVRSYGGDVATTIALADLLRERRATVVIYDYCIFACASYLFMASNKTFVIRGAIVAWRHLTSGPNDCPSLEEAEGGGPKRVTMRPCPHSPPAYQGQYEQVRRLSNEFYSARSAAATGFEVPPQSFTVRKILKNKFEGRGVYPDVFWTWHPRYYASTIRTEVIYEAYPQSQDEVDAVVTKLGLDFKYRVLHDP